MILCFSTSSPWASIALIDGTAVLWHGAQEAPRAASGACLSMMERMQKELGLKLEEVSLFAADVGPGSFTGVRVGITLAKTFGFVYGRQVVGADAFDLVDPSQPVAIPSKRGECFLRVPGHEPVRQTEVPQVIGYGPGLSEQQFPSAACFAPLWQLLQPTSAAEFMPNYLIQPSISTPKKAYRQLQP